MVVGRRYGFPQPSLQKDLKNGEIGEIFLKHTLLENFS